MRNFLRAFIGLSIVLLALSVTALSCNKDGDDKNGANNSGGNNGGSGGGNSFPAATGSIAINILDDDKVMLEPDAAVNAVVNADTTSQPSDATTSTGASQKTLLINSTALKAPHDGIGLTGGIANISELNLAQTLGHLFDLTITGGVAGDAYATAGLVLVSTGDLAGITNFSTLAPGSVPTANSGIYVAPPNVPNSPDVYKKRGFRFYGIFGDTSTPNNNNPNEAPFAFSYDKTTTSTLARQPVLACRSVITSISSTDPNSAARPTPDKVLTDGHTARCFLIARQNFADDAAISSWFNAAATALNDGNDTTHFKTAFSISVAAIRTDAKPLKDVLAGFPQTTDQSKVDAFMNGLDKDEMALLARNNIYAYQKILVKIVNQAEFDDAKVKVNGGPPPPGTIVFENFDTSVAEMVGDTIQIKASGLPPAVGTDIVGADIITFATATADKAKRAFDIRIKASGLAAKEGLILVGPGNLLDTNNNFTNFSIDRGITQGLANHSFDQTQRGISSQVGAAGHSFFQVGWNIFSSFMSSQAPRNPATADANARPFAFTQTVGTGATKPLFFCKTALTEATGDAAVKADTTLAGGQVASCYVGVVGADFVRQAGDDWLNRTAGNIFKKKFNIAVAGIKTDGKTIAGANGIGLPGADDAAKVANFKDGLSRIEMAALTTLNSSAHKKVAIELVRGAFQPYVPPLLPGTTDIVFENFDDTVAEMVGDTIKLKASGLPLAVGGGIANTDIATYKVAWADQFKRAFDIRIKAGSASALGGLLLVGPANLLDTNNNVTNFSIDQGVAKRFRDYETAGSDLKQGIVSEAAATSDIFLQKGWNILAPFMDSTPANGIDANARPFSFSQTTGPDALKPLFFCRTTLSTITGDAAVKSDTELAGGEIASCYVALTGAEFSGKVGDDWLKAKENNAPNFKSKFNIAIAGIRTDRKTIAGDEGIGLPGADDATQVANFKDGISATEMKQIANANPSIYKKVAVELVRGDFPVYIPPLNGDSICIDKGSSYCLELTINSSASGYAKIVDKTNIIIDATELSKVTSPHSSDYRSDRTFQKLVDSIYSPDAVKDLFKVAYPGGKQNLVFITRKNSTTNDIVIPDTTGSMRWCFYDESDTLENSLAVRKEGAYCLFRGGSPYKNYIDTYSYLGAVFNNTDASRTARGVMRCKGKFADGTAAAIDDTTVSTQSDGQLCALGVVNNAEDNTSILSLSELDNSWIDHPYSITESELYAVGFDIDGKTFPQFLPAADNFELRTLTRDGIDNPTFKKMLEHNNWKDLRFKVKIVKGADLPPVNNADLVIMPSAWGKRYGHVKVVDETNVYVSAHGLSNEISNAYMGTGYHRVRLGFGDIPDYAKEELFYIDYPGGYKETAMIFVTRNHVTTNEIALDAMVGRCTGVSEGTENSRAVQANGGVCRTASGAYGDIGFDSYLGTAFDNTDDSRNARGLLRCSQYMESWLGRGGDDAEFKRDLSRCEIGVINSAVSPTEVIDNLWVSDPDSRTEMEFNVIAIKITRKSLADIVTDLGFTFSPGSASTAYKKEWTNSDIKKLMSKYEWRQRKIKVKLVGLSEYKNL